MKIVPGLTRFILLLFIIFCLSPQDNARAGFDEEFPPQDNWTKISPSVVWCNDPDDTVTIEVHIKNRNDVDRVWVTDLGSDEPEGRLELFDDGTHGDATAGDNTFTLADVVLPCRIVGDYGIWWRMLRVRLAS